MDLELGLKITKTKDDIALISEYRFAKDKAGPIFQSTETNTMFILTAHLKGYKRNNINIKISEDGSRISISGRKPIQNILMMGWLMHKKEVDVVGFNKVFKIPDGVKLDGIKAKYDEEDRMLNISMPKLVKGICGAKIEEVKVKESGREGLDPEKREAEQILSSVGETSHKKSKESKVQAIEDNASFMEEKEGGASDKMLDNANSEIIKDTKQKEVENSKLGTEGGNRESFGESVEKEGYEVMHTSELKQNVDRDTSRKIGDTSQNEIEESNLGVDDKGVKGMREEVRKTDYEAVKTSEMEKNADVAIPHSKGDTSQNEVFGVQEMKDNEGFVKEEKMVREKMFDEANANKIKEVIKKEIKDSNSEVEDKDGQSVKEKIGKAGYEGEKTSNIEQNVLAHVTQNIGDTGQGVSGESVVEQMREAKRTIGKMEEKKSQEMLAKVNVPSKEETIGESKQQQFGEPKFEVEDKLKESCMELTEIMMTPKLDLDVDHQTMSNIGGTSQEKHTKSKLQQKEKTRSIKENMDRREHERMHVEVNKDSQNLIFGDQIKKPMIETNDVDQECLGEEASKKEFDSMETIREELPKLLPKATIEERKRLHASKMQEGRDVKETMIKRKQKRNQNFVDKDEGEESKRIVVEAKSDIIMETRQESEDVKKTTAEKEGKNIQDFIGEGEGEECKKMHVEAQKNFQKETTQESEHFKEAMVESEDEDPKGMHVKAKKDLTINTMQQIEDVNKVMVKRKDEEVAHFENDGEVEEPKRTRMEAKKDLEKETMQECKEDKEAIVKRKGKQIEQFVKKGEGKELNRKQMEAKKELTKETMQENEDIKETMVKRKGKENEQFADKDEGEESKRMHIKATKDLAKETMQENEDVEEVIAKREGQETKCFVDTSKDEEYKRMHITENKDLTKETMEESEDVKEAIVKRKDKEIEYFSENGEGEESNRIHMEAKNDLKTESVQESEDVKEAIIKRKGKEINYLLDENEGAKSKRMHVKSNKDSTTKEMKETKDDKEIKIKRKDEANKLFAKNECEEPKRMFMEDKKKFIKDVTQESDDVKKNMVKRKGQDIEYFLDKGEEKEPKKMHMEAKKDLTTEAIQESEDVKEIMVKLKGVEIEYFLDEGEGKESKRHREAKDLTMEQMQEIKDVKEVIMKRQDEAIENFVNKDESEDHRKMLTETKEELTKQTMQVNEDVKDEIVKRKGKEIEFLLDKGEGEEPKKMRMQITKDLEAETMQGSEHLKEATVKKKDKEIECFVDMDKDEDSKRMHMEENKDLTKETMQKSEDVKEAMIKREDKDIDYFLDYGDEDEEPNRMRLKSNDLTTETMPKSVNLKEAMVKRKSKDNDYFVDDDDDESEEPKRMHMEAKDSIKENMQESEGVKGVMIKRTDKEIRNFANNGDDKLPERMYMEAKDLTEKIMQESGDIKETTIKRKDKKINYSVDKGKGVEPKRTHMKAKKDITKDSMQKEIKKIKSEIKDNDQLVKSQDGSSGLKVANMEEKKEVIKETTVETESLMEKVIGEKYKNTEKVNSVTEKTTPTEILQKETKESNIERNSKDGPYLLDNMVKVVFEVLGTFQANLSKKMIEAIAQDKETGAYVIVKLKGEGSIKMHIEPNETYDDAFKDKIEKDIRKPNEGPMDQQVQIDFHKGVQKAEKDEMSVAPKAIQRKKHHELSLPSKDYKIPKIDEVQLKKEKERVIHAPEATTSKDEELAQRIATHSIAEGDIDKPLVIHLSSSSVEMRSKEPCELHKHDIKKDDPKDKSLAQIQKGRESIHSIKGNAISEAVVHQVAEPSKFLSPSTQPSEVAEKYEIKTSSDQESQDMEKDSEIDGQESTEGKRDQEVKQKETLQPEFLENQQFINKDHEEESHGTHEIEEEKVYDQEDSQAFEECKECEEVPAGKKNDQKRSKKLFVSMIVAGSTLIASGIFLFIRHKRSKKVLNDTR